MKIPQPNMRGCWIKDDWAIVTIKPTKVVSYAGGRSRRKLEAIAIRMNGGPQFPHFHRYVVRFCVHRPAALRARGAA